MNLLLTSLATALAFTRLVQAGLPREHVDLQKQIVKHHATMVYETYRQAHTMAVALESAAAALAKSPSAETMEGARKAWIAARKPYAYSECFRYYAGPIDDEDGPEPQLNAWPLDEAVIDAVRDSPVLSVIADARRYPALTTELLSSLNQVEGEKGVTCGYHAVEFLLWGEDSDPRGPGRRSYTDYSSAPHAERRGEYLRCCTRLIVEQLRGLMDEWAPQKLGNYRAVFEEGYDQSVERIFYGMIFLTGNELAGERTMVAIDTREQEDEQSCFSDTTHLDHLWNAEGLCRVWSGEYESAGGSMLQGPGLAALGHAFFPAAAGKVERLLHAHLQHMKVFPAPFDAAIAGADESAGRAALVTLMESAGDLSTALRALAVSLGLEIPGEAPEGIEG